MEKIRLIKILILVAAVFGAITFFGVYFFRTPDEALLGVTTISSGSAEGQEILQALNDLKGLKIDESVFSIPAYETLVDFSTTITPEEKQRPNPFAPIGIETPTVIRTAPKAIPNE